MKAAPAILIVMLGAMAGCRFPTRLDPYRCKSTAECPAPAECIEGFCVEPSAADSAVPGTDATGPGTDAMAGTDAAMPGTDSNVPGTDAAPGCGDGTCDPSAAGMEDCLTCSTDCGGCAGGGCGNGTCGGGESCVNCPMDCPGPC